MKTVKRISKLSEAVKIATHNLDKNLVVADIATDHGYLAEALSKQENIQKIFATDISSKCLNKVVELIKNNNLQKIETLVGDGLIPIDSVDVAVIAGVGGFEIIKMLEKQNRKPNGDFKCRLFVLQPAQNVLELRTWLFDNEIFMIKDYVIEDAERFYPIIIVDVSKTQNNEKNIFNLWLGRDNDLNSNDFKNFLFDSLTFLEFLNDLPQQRIDMDKTLKDKQELKLLIENLLK